MAKLSKEQEASLAELEALRDAPDEPTGSGRSEVLNFTIDLGNDAAVERALKLGILKPEDVEDADDDEDDDGDGDADKDPQPRRRLTGADRIMGEK